MAEVIAGIGLAAAVAQLTSYGIHIISDGHEYYHSARGAKSENLEVELVIKDLQDLSSDIIAQQEAQGKAFSVDDKAIMKLSEATRPITEKLLSILEELECRGNTRYPRLESLRQAIRSSRKKKDIEELEVRLRRVREEATTRMLKMFNDKQSHVLRALERLSDRGTEMETNITRKLDSILSKIDMRVHRQAETDVDTTDGLSEMVSELAGEVRKVEREQKILESLRYESMYQRRFNIHDAHHQTLSWVFERESGRPFISWIQSKSGIFWVQGKAGSGKSTLMKYISGHERTPKILRSWAGSKQLVMASYFFWIAGLPMQKSTIGLLQSLLYQVLRSCPELIMAVCAEHDISERWSVSELECVFGSIAEHVQRGHVAAKFCFFIDGLDEYNGDEDDVIHIVKKLATCQAFKLCVSSRPWVAFRKAFDGLPSDQKFLMEVLTRDDMRAYVTRMLEADPHFNKLATEDDRCQGLSTQITEDAQGVWLWVYLVVRDLLRDLKRNEKYDFLKRRLDAFPRELSKYFEDILRRVDPIYRQETAQIFLVALQSVAPLPLYAFAGLEEERDNLGYALEADIKAVDSCALHSELSRREDLLNNRCKDLLEVRNAVGDSFFGCQVDFLHRTVRDFLQNEHQETIRTQAGQSFDPRMSLCRTLLAMLKALPSEGRLRVNVIFRIVDEFLYYAHSIDRDTRKPAFGALGGNDYESVARGIGRVDSSTQSPTQMKLYELSLMLDELDRVNSVHAGGKRCHWTNARDSPRGNGEPYDEGGHNSFLALTIQAGLWHYVDEKLDGDPELLTDKRGRPLLDYALRPKRVTPADLPYRLLYQDANIQLDLITLLLDRGASPNKVIHLYGDYTVWGLFLAYCQNNSAAPKEMKAAWHRAIKAMIKHRADPNLTVAMFRNHELERIPEVDTTEVPVSQILHNLFGSNKAERLRREMEEVSAQNRWGIWRWIPWY